MLILTRRIYESIKIGEGIEVRIVGVDGDQVKLGIRAPRDVAVHREEVYHRIRAEREAKTRALAPSSSE